MPRPYNSFLGPTARWLDDEDDETYVLGSVLHQGREALGSALRDRAAVMESPLVTPDELMLEIRKQLAETGVTGDVVRGKELSELALELVHASMELHSRL